MLFTGGDMIFTHHANRLFTRQLSWALQETKRRMNLNLEAAEMLQDDDNVQLATVAIEVNAAHVEREEDDAAADSVDNADPEGGGDDLEPPAGDTTPQLSNMEEDGEADAAMEEEAVRPQEAPRCATTAATMRVKSCNTADDYAHRGPALASMPFYVYVMHVRRVPRTSDEARFLALLPFEEHYPMATGYAQGVRGIPDVPQIDGYQMPAMLQNAEDNCCLKAMLFTPWRCESPDTCHTTEKFQHMVRYDTTLQSYTFKSAWRLRRAELEVLASRANSRREAAQKVVVLHDTTLARQRREPEEAIMQGEATRLANRAS